MRTSLTPGPGPSDPGRIVELVRESTALLPFGEHQLRGSCPFCGSLGFRVRPAFDTFHCFGCGEGGDAAAFTARCFQEPPGNPHDSE